jgi:hypothetical protein
LGDIDGDGILDFASANTNNTQFSSVGYYFGNGNGTFSNQTLLFTDANGCNLVNNEGAMAVVFGDFNRDGKMDMAVGQGCNGTGRIMIFFGYGDGTFNTTSPGLITVPSSSNPYVDQLALVDFNNDGVLDLAAVSRNGNLLLYQGVGDGTFTLKSNTPTGIGATPLRLSVGDINNDGIPDYVISASGSNFAVSLGGSNGTISSTSPYVGLAALSGFAGKAVLVDWDDDGKLDIILQRNYAGYQFLKGNGDGTFVAPSYQYSLPNPGQQSFNQLFMFDANGDGLPDILSLSVDSSLSNYSLGFSFNKSQ